MSDGPVVLGINSAYHETSACVVRGGAVVAACEEERFNRIKHGKLARVDNADDLPWRAIEASMTTAAVRAADIDAVAFSLMPGARASTVGVDGPDAIDVSSGWGTEHGEALFDAALRRVPEAIHRRLRIPLEKFRFVPHHLSHAASAFLVSPFKAAAVLVLDGIGEDKTGWAGIGCGNDLTELFSWPYPNSLGFLWERIAVYLGFTEYDAAKVMGLAAFGDPRRFRREIDAALHVSDTGFDVVPDVVRPRAGDVRGLEVLFGPRRQPCEPATGERFASVARALQEQTTSALIAVARHLARLTGLGSLCYAGGVALNCVANAALQRAGVFRRICIPGAAHDAGTAVGAALYVAMNDAQGMREMGGGGLEARLGPEFSDADIVSAISSAGLAHTYVAMPAAVAAREVAAGKIVGWFQGRMEFGPRALGCRSVIADPRSENTRHRLNIVVKRRETFRPYGASVLSDHVGDWFDVPSCCEMAPATLCSMLLAYPVRGERKSAIPSCVHVDGTCRVQTVGPDTDGTYYDLIRSFHDYTGVPLVLNTSFNDQEPIVCTPEDAIRTAQRSGMDMLVIGHHAVQLSGRHTANLV